MVGVFDEEEMGATNSPEHLVSPSITCQQSKDDTEHTSNALIRGREPASHGQK